MMFSILVCNIYTIIYVWDSVCCCSRKNQFTIVPILVGSLSPDKEQQYGAIFSSYLASPENLFVVSSDFCHWGQSVMLKWKQHSPCLFCIQFVCTFHLLIWFCLFSPLSCLFGIEFVCPFTLVIWCSVCFSSYPAYLVSSLFPPLSCFFGVQFIFLLTLFICAQFMFPLTLLFWSSVCFSSYPTYLFSIQFVFPLTLPTYLVFSLFFLLLFCFECFTLPCLHGVSLFPTLPVLFGVGVEFGSPLTLLIWCSFCFSPYPAYLVFILFLPLPCLFGVHFVSPLILLIWCSFCFSLYHAYLVFILFLPLPCLFGVHLCGNRNKNIYQIWVGDKVICVEVEMEEFTKTRWMLVRSF